jgi:hypothetical protein
MTRDGWIFMLATWTLILGLFLFSVVRTLLEKDDEDKQPKT